MIGTPHPGSLATAMADLKKARELCDTAEKALLAARQVHAIANLLRTDAEARIKLLTEELTRDGERRSPKSEADAQALQDHT